MFFVRLKECLEVGRQELKQRIDALGSLDCLIGRYS